MAGILAAGLCGAPAQERLADVGAEVLRADDITISEAWVLGRRTDLRTEWTASLAWDQNELDYAPAPVDLIGYSTTRRESRLAARLGGRIRTADQVEATCGAGAYDGFTDYRSIWLDEYYRQLFEGVDGYERAEPRGYDVSAGGRWEYLPASGFVSATVRYQRDEVSPGYEKLLFEPLRRGLSRLTTWSLSLGSEHVVNRSVRLKQDFEAIDTTARPWRLRYAAEILWAPAEHWVIRPRIEFSWEDAFHSASASLALEHDWRDTWFVGVTARGYRDNGQIVDPDLITGAAPALDTLQAALSLRYHGLRTAASITAGPYHTRYAELAPGTLRFAGLYRDRDWGWFQAVWSLRF